MVRSINGIHAQVDARIIKNTCLIVMMTGSVLDVQRISYPSNVYELEAVITVQEMLIQGKIVHLTSIKEKWLPFSVCT